MSETTAFDGLGKALRWIRDKQDKKQYEVADAAGVTKAMLSAYETGKQKPSLDTLEKIMQALCVDLADLYNAIQTVNERPVRWRLPDRTDSRIERRGPSMPIEADVDVYRALGLDRPLARAEELAFSIIISGHNQLLRYYHESFQELLSASRGGSGRSSGKSGNGKVHEDDEEQ
ncbi:MAG TPA: helix-turn-helix domain-containing protein [Thermoanaerobaculia bacterium]|nr:helix-turn-helix domain-containing protein [Thermoanaerobaculia bacterium]